jgi:hypothetical protein
LYSTHQATADKIKIFKTYASVKVAQWYAVKEGDATMITKAF